MKKSIKWLQCSIGSIVFIIVIVSIFNYKIDSLSLFGNNKILESAAKDLIKGNMISGLTNYDERLFQKLIIKNIKVKNNVIVLGSSRSMQLRKRYFLNGKDTFFNHSVSSANIKDLIAVIGIYEKEKGYIPKSIIINIDPWNFNKNIIQNRWKTNLDYYNFEISKMNLLNTENISNFYLLKQLINYSYTISNIKYYIHLLQHNNKIYTLVDKINNDSIKEIDGSIDYPIGRRNLSISEINKVTRFYISHQNDFSKFKKLSNRKLFELFIQYLKSKNINISFLLTPVHPLLYNDIKLKNNSLQLVEHYLKSFAKKNNIKIYGSYNYNIYNLNSHDFYDALHCKDTVIKMIMKKEINAL